MIRYPMPLRGHPSDYGERTTFAKDAAITSSSASLGKVSDQDLDGTTAAARLAQFRAIRQQQGLDMARDRVSYPAMLDRPDDVR